MGKSLGDLFIEICMMLTKSTAKKMSDEQLTNAYRQQKKENGDKRVVGELRKEMERRRL